MTAAGIPPETGETAEEVDTRALAMRREGKSFAFIATALHFRRAGEAHAAFLRAIRSHPEVDQKRLCDEELGRLGKLEQRVRADAELAPFDRDRRLDVIQQLRERLQPR
jgi:hypothetical protein